MNAQDLKNSILQLAIQGKLVEQREEEGTAKELLEKIEAEKKQLIKEGKIKKQKALPEIKEDEIPFDIPESWEWVRLGDAFEIIMGQSPKGTSVFEGDGGIEFHQGKVYFGSDYLEYSNQSTNKPTKIVEPNTVLLCVRAPVGILNITERQICIGRGLCGINTFSGMESKFLMNSLRAFKYDFIRKATGTTFVAITGEVVKNQLIPLPPLAEQKRIVAKIEELMPYVDKYDVAYSEVEELNKKFPEDMQKSILQYAIQGKLVEQREKEGTAEELYQQIQEEKKKLIEEGKIKKTKALPEITEDEIPFDIPESWKWVRLQDITIFENGDRSSKYPKESDYVTNGIPFFGAKDMGEEYMKFDDVRFISKDKFKELGNGKLQDGDVVCLLRGSVGKMARFQSNERYNTGFICAQMLILRFLNKEVIDYISYAIKSPMFKTVLESKITGTAVRQLPAAELAKVIVPLPPLEEQKRIVLKVKEMLPYCQQLVK
ncbi:MULTISPECIES: restriction endonuclease subunit S [Bacillus]|uniref:restriction endonuclease subunit S n=1 Tax=Bacillus TaxID=1386 RepID=UPI000F76B19F|nr:MULTISPECIES: restriction endonuclease subunit S [Bacillus]MDJ0288217.1 restriction endonuclease subunit S [Bacillus altitudinis]